jgi:hypothetical protein
MRCFPINALIPPIIFLEAEVGSASKGVGYRAKHFAYEGEQS